MKGPGPALQPSLWRTCRALANTRRLRLLHALLDKPGQTVSDLAARLALPVTITSTYLRALNARGLLQVTRSSRWVHYRAAPDPTVRETAVLLAAIERELKRNHRPIPAIFKDLTAFTHPRRIVIIQCLAHSPQPFGKLVLSTGISRRALRRHLDKLQRREMITRKPWPLIALRPQRGLARVLLRLAILKS